MKGENEIVIKTINDITKRVNRGNQDLFIKGFTNYIDSVVSLKEFHKKYGYKADEEELLKMLDHFGWVELHGELISLSIG